MLRLVFHDSGTFNVTAGNGGANASIQHELDRPENFGLKRAWKVIQQAMTNILGTAAEGVVSYADMIALVGAYAVGLCGGPLISVPVGQSPCIVDTGRLNMFSNAAVASTYSTFVLVLSCIKYVCACVIARKPV